MVGQAVPLFKAGNLLTKEMLSALKEYSFGFGELLYEGYSDGILSGCRITATEDLLQLNRGIMIYTGRLYLIQKPLTQEYYPTDKETVFKLWVKDEIKTSGFIYREIETLLTEDTSQKNGELELCRFKLQKGFKLRTDYKDFADRNTQYDTVNIIHSPYAAYGESSVPADITVDFARYLRNQKDENILDQVFCMHVYESNGRAVNRNTIIYYLCKRLSIEHRAYTNLEIFKFMEDILREGSDTKNRKQQVQNQGRRVLLD